jgi:hypothetical protein
MPQEPETRTCKLCRMAIPVGARKCPHCHHWQRWLSLQNPAILALLILVPVFILNGIVMQTFWGRMVREWEPFPKHSQDVIIVEEKMEFGEDGCGPAVIIVGRVKNATQVDWKDVRFQVEFLNPTGQLFDTGQQEAWTYRLPAGRISPFKISFNRQFPEKEYVSHKVTIISAVDGRQWP